MSPVHTGTVKFYLRNKAYGFIVPDDPQSVGHSGEVWVHRTSFDTPHDPLDFPTRPYLLKNERVRFQIAPANDDGQTDKAIRLVFENGREVPLYRKNYAVSVVNGEQRRLGEAVLEILANTDSSHEDQFEQIQEAARTVEETIAQAAAHQETYGPEMTTTDQH